MDTLSVLRKHSIQPTPQRPAVAKIVHKSEKHSSADEVSARSRACSPISRGTVYNALSLFVERGS